jgi:SOS-response transcriptional repressor LexA
VTDTLTPRQRNVLAFVRTSTADNGYPPSLREIGDAVGLSSVNSVHHQLRALERKGFLRRGAGQPRVIVITDTAERACSVDESDRGADLVRQALHLRMHGERAPGWRGRENETWAEWDRAAEEFLDSMRSGGAA